MYRVCTTGEWFNARRGLTSDVTFETRIKSTDACIYVVSNHFSQKKEPRNIL